MKIRSFLLLSLAVVSTLMPTLGGSISGVHASPPSLQTLMGQTPTVVVAGRATLRGQHDPNAVLTMDIGLAVHDSAQLDALADAANDPSNPQYGQYLTDAQYMAQFAP